MDRLVLPMVSDDDSPQGALNQMRLGDARAVVVKTQDGYKILSNEDVLRSAGAGLARLGEIQDLGFEAVGLAENRADVWRGLGSAEEMFSEGGAGTAAAAFPATASLSNALSAANVEYGVVGTLGSAAVVVTATETLAQRHRTKTKVCACTCDHHPIKVETEKPPEIEDGKPCFHGNGHWRCI